MKLRWFGDQQIMSINVKSEYRNMYDKGDRSYRTPIIRELGWRS